MYASSGMIVPKPAAELHSECSCPKLQSILKMGDTMFETQTFRLNLGSKQLAASEKDPSLVGIFDFPNYLHVPR